MYVILVYDIAVDENGPKVWRKVFKECKKYLVHIQNSVFEGELSDPQLMKLKLVLGKLLRDDLDSIIIFKSRQEKWLQKDMMGLQKNDSSQFI